LSSGARSSEGSVAGVAGVVVGSVEGIVSISAPFVYPYPPRHPSIHMVVRSLLPEPGNR
jgi:hypothetical protein